MSGYLPPPIPLSPLRSSFPFSSNNSSPILKTSLHRQRLQDTLNHSRISLPDTIAKVSLSNQSSSEQSSETSSSHTSPASVSSWSTPSSPVTSWTNHHVRDWLESLNCGLWYKAFEENHIAGDILLECDSDSLRDLGITKVGDRIRIQQSLKRLRRKTTELDAALALNASSADSDSKDAKDLKDSKHDSFSSTLTPADNQRLKAAVLANLATSRETSPEEGYFTPTGTLTAPGKLPNTPPELPPKPPLTSSRSRHHNSNSTQLPTSAPDSAILDSLQSTLQPPERQPPATFINARGQCVAVNVSRYFDALSVKKKAFKKFSSKKMSLNNPKSLAASPSSIPNVIEPIRPEKCVIFVTESEKGSNVRQVSDFELITICHTITRQERDRLMICPKNSTPTHAQIASSKQIIKNFVASSASNSRSFSPSTSCSTVDNSSLSNPPRSASSIQSFDESDVNYSNNFQANPMPSPNVIPGKKGMSSANASSSRQYYKDEAELGSSQNRDAPSRKSLTDVQGLRPDSMHISKNLKSLQEYFPEAGAQALRQTIRNSQMYTKRMSRMSRISHRSSVAMYFSGNEQQDDDAPPLPSLEDIWKNTFGSELLGPARNSQRFPTGLGQPPATSSTASVSSSPALPQSANKMQHISHDSPSASLSGLAANLPNTPTSNAYIPSREYPTNYPSTTPLEEKMLPPVPGQRSSTQQPSPRPPISRHASNMSVHSNMSSHASQNDTQNPNNYNSNTLDNAINAGNKSEQSDNEDEFMELIQLEETGPSRWIKGSFIGAGSFGHVYLGLNSITGEIMAVKQVEMPLGSEHEQRKRSMIDALQREMNLLRDLEHPNIVQYLGSNCENNHLNIFLEYVPGGSVSSLLANVGPFEDLHIRKVVKQILLGLKYLHSRSIIHRDIKGANILMDNHGNIKISDFGISTKLDNNKKDRASFHGSIYWMAPEVVRQIPYTYKVDIWSLGCLVIEMYTGKRPFPDMKQIQALFHMSKKSPQPPATPANASPEGQDFLKKAFEIDHTRRPTAAEMLQHPFVAGFGQEGI